MAQGTTPDFEGRRQLTPFTCPSCGGALWEVEQEGVDSYECHVGHRFGSEAMMALAGERTENILWAAVRALQEDGALKRRMAARAAARGMTTMAQRWQADARGSDRRSRRIRSLIEAMNDGENARLPADVPGKRALNRGALRKRAGDIPAAADAAARSSRPSRGRKRAEGKSTKR